MGRIRNTFAYPFYFMAFLLHLLCAGLTSAAQTIAGDDRDISDDPNLKEGAGWAFGTMLMVAGGLGIAVVPALVYRDTPINEARLAVVRPMKDSEFAKVDFTPATLASLLPQIKLVACIFAEKAVRYHVSPALVSLPSCGWSHDLVTVAPNLIDITVSGTATIEKVDHHFTVVLQHNPPSVTEDGIIITDIRVEGFNS